MTSSSAWILSGAGIPLGKRSDIFGADRFQACTVFFPKFRVAGVASCEFILGKGAGNLRFGTKQAEAAALTEYAAVNWTTAFIGHDVNYTTDGV